MELPISREWHVLESKFQKHNEFNLQYDAIKILRASLGGLGSNFQSSFFCTFALMLRGARG